MKAQEIVFSGQGITPRTLTLENGQWEKMVLSCKKFLGKALSESTQELSQYEQRRMLNEMLYLEVTGEEVVPNDLTLRAEKLPEFYDGTVSVVRFEPITEVQDSSLSGDLDLINDTEASIWFSEINSTVEDYLRQISYYQVFDLQRF